MYIVHVRNIVAWSHACCSSLTVVPAKDPPDALGHEQGSHAVATLRAHVSLPMTASTAHLPFTVAAFLPHETNHALLPEAGNDA
jgi:hypothetical protein